MNRADWQQIAEEKLLAAEALIATKQWSSAYYLAGYAIECGLKSCILARLAGTPEVIFDEGNKTYSEKCWCHDIEKLLGLADLKTVRDAEIHHNPALAINWAIVNKWSELARYRTTSSFEAQAFYNAITDRVSGVMQWIRVRW